MLNAILYFNPNFNYQPIKEEIEWYSGPLNLKDQIAIYDKIEADGKTPCYIISISKDVDALLKKYTLRALSNLDVIEFKQRNKIKDYIFEFGEEDLLEFFI